MADDTRSETTPQDAAAPPGSCAGVSRRSFIQTLGISAVAAGVQDAAAQPSRVRPEEAPDPGVPEVGPDAIRVALRVNGRPLEANVHPSTTLLEMLRMDLDLTGSKVVCDRGACGACSVLVNDTLTVSCMMLAADAAGAEVRTVEGLEEGGELSDLQLAFIRHDALQCGYCTPGLLMACQALLEETPRPSLDEIKKGLSGNLCRCGTYTNIFNAVLDASGQEPIADAFSGAQEGS